MKKDLAKTLLFINAELLLMWHLWLTYKHPAKLGSIGRGAAIRLLSHSYGPCVLTTSPLSLVSGCYNEPPGEWPLTHHRESSQPWAGSDLQRLVARGHSAGVEVSPGLLTLAPDPGSLYPLWVRSGAQRTEIACREQGMSNYSAVSCSALTTRDCAGQSN